MKVPHIILAFWPMFGARFGQPDKRTRKNGKRIVRKQIGGTPRKALTDFQQAKSVKAVEQIMLGRKAHAERQAACHGGFYAGQLACGAYQ